MRHYLSWGWPFPQGLAVSFESYLLAGTAMRGNLAPLASAWAQHGREILARWVGPGRPWAERRLGALAHGTPRNGKNGSPRAPRS
jgi:hypothetical protein